MSRPEKKGAKRLISVAQIGEVRLVKASADTQIYSPSDVEGDLVLSTRHGSLLKSLPDESRIFLIHALVEAFVVSPQAKSTPLLSVHATFELRYRVPEGFSASQKEFESFTETNAVFNAWPYFREFIQSMTTRMNLPPVVLPLFRLGEQTSEGRASRTKQRTKRDGTGG